LLQQHATPRRTSTVRHSSSSSSGDPGSTAEPIGEFLLQQGFRAELVTRLLHDRPDVTHCSLETRIIPLCRFLLDLGLTPEHLQLMVFKWVPADPWILPELLVPAGPAQTVAATCPCAGARRCSPSTWSAGRSRRRRS
jgi:hypothetical protein